MESDVAAPARADGGVEGGGDGIAVLDRYEPLVDEFDAFRAACERPLPVVVRTNAIKATADRAATAFREAGIDAVGRDWHPALLELGTARPGNTWPYVHGWVHGQEEVSTVPPLVLDPEPGDVVLDSCAAPGGKATQLAALMDDRGLVVANDDSLGRLSALRGNADRLGVTCAAVTNQDGRRLSLSGLGIDADGADGGDGADGAVDDALVDAPCTCEGTVRKNPDVLADWSESHLDGIAPLQADLLRRAVELTRPGGTVVYSTCTFAPEENEAVLDRVLADGDCRVVPYDLSLEHSPGVTEWLGESYDPSVARAKRIYPHQNDTGGFFCAKLEVEPA